MYVFVYRLTTDRRLKYMQPSIAPLCFSVGMLACISDQSFANTAKVCVHMCAPGNSSLTRPVRLGLPLTDEATELMELMEEALGLRLRPAGVVTTFRTAVVLALAGVVDGKPMRVTLCTGANSPYLGWHWKYLDVRSHCIGQVEDTTFATIYHM